MGLVEVTHFHDETKAERIAFILERLKQGDATYDIYRELPHRTLRRYGPEDNSNKIGLASEKRVYDLLLNLQLVDDLLFDDKYKKGIEGFVGLNPKYCSRYCVPLQVKSSDVAIRVYYDSPVYDWAKARYGEIVVLNGGAGVVDDHDIVISFVEQLITIGALAPQYNHGS